MEKEGLVKFMEPLARELSQEELDKASGTVSVVTTLTAKNFDTQVMKSKDAWVVAYTASGETPEGFEKLGEDLRKSGLVKAGKVDCSKYAEICKDETKGLAAGKLGVFDYRDSKDDADKEDEAKPKVNPLP